MADERADWDAEYVRHRETTENEGDGDATLRRGDRFTGDEHGERDEHARHDGGHHPEHEQYPIRRSEATKQIEDDERSSECEHQFSFRQMACERHREWCADGKGDCERRDERTGRGNRNGQSIGDIG